MWAWLSPSSPLCCVTSLPKTEMVARSGIAHATGLTWTQRYGYILFVIATQEGGAKGRRCKEAPVPLVLAASGCSVMLVELDQAEVLAKGVRC